MTLLIKVTFSDDAFERQEQIDVILISLQQISANSFMKVIQREKRRETLRREEESPTKTKQKSEVTAKI